MEDVRQGSEELQTHAMTIADIAEELGVSKSTVSRVISGKGRIGDETRNRVQDWIRRHHYIPNSSARALASNRTYNAAVVIPRDADRGDMPFFQECLTGLVETFTERGYDTVVSIVDGSDVSSLERLVRHRKVDGVVLTRLVKDDAALAFLQSESLPFVVLGTVQDDSVYQIDSDQSAGCYDLTRLVLDSGVERLVLLAGNRDHEVNRLRYEGIVQACEGSGIKLLSEHWNLQTVQDVSAALLQCMSQKPQCIVCIDDVICIKALSWLKKNEYSVPGSVRVVSCYDSEALKTHVPPVTALSVSAWDLCSTAGNALLDIIEDRPVAKKIPVGFQVKIRESSRSVREK